MDQANKPRRIRFGFVMLLAVIAGIYIHQNHVLKCHTEDIPFSTVEETDPYKYVAESYDRVSGKTGTREICEHHNGELVSNKVIASPVNRVHVTGTAIPSGPYVAPPRIEYEGSGAICNDGTRSYSTGRGTCSWHGGVADWL